VITIGLLSAQEDADMARYRLDGKVRSGWFAALMV
jgi:hypothetical protein